MSHGRNHHVCRRIHLFCRRSGHDHRSRDLRHHHRRICRHRRSHEIYRIRRRSRRVYRIHGHHHLRSGPHGGRRLAELAWTAVRNVHVRMAEY